MCFDDFFFFSFFSLEISCQPFSLFSKLFLVFVAWRPQVRISRPVLDSVRRRWQSAALLRNVWYISLGYDSSGRYFYPREKNKKKRRKVDTTRWGRHNMAVIRNRVLIWFEAAKEIAKIKSRERCNQKRRGKKEYVKKISLERRDEQDCTIRKTNSMFSSRDSKWGNKKCQRELGIFQML